MNWTWIPGGTMIEMMPWPKYTPPKEGKYLVKTEYEYDKSVLTIGKKTIEQYLQASVSMHINPATKKEEWSIDVNNQTVVAISSLPLPFKQ